MRAASDIADWWDKQHATSKKWLDSFVDENPNLFGVLVATALATCMEVGKGTVDVLRFGEGIAEGTPGGVAQDALRAMSIVGTVGKGFKIIKEVAARSKMMKLIVDPGGGRCAYVSATQALRQTGQKAYAAVDDLARELKVPLKNLGGAHVTDLREALTKLKVKMGPLKFLGSWKEIERAVPHDGSVMSFGVDFVGGGGHRLYAFRDALGRVKILDRGGSAGKLPEILGSLADVAKKYSRSGIKSFNPAFEIKDVFLKFVGPKGLATLAMEVLGTTTVDAETLTQKFEDYKQKRGVVQGPETKVAGGFTVEVSAGSPDKSTLSGIAKAQYGDFNLWPLIFDLNRGKIGQNPNRLKPGTKLLLLPLESYTPAELANARKRAPTWKYYPL